MEQFWKKLWFDVPHIILSSNVVVSNTLSTESSRGKEPTGETAQPHRSKFQFRKFRSNSARLQKCS